MAIRVRGAAASRLSGPVVLAGLVLAFTLASAFGHGEQAHLASGSAPAASVPAAVDPVLGGLRSAAQWATYCGLALVGALPFARFAAPNRRDNRRIRLLVVLGCGTCGVTALVGLLLFGPIALGRGTEALGDGVLVAATLGTSHGRLLLLQAVTALLLAPVAARVLLASGPAPGWENLALGLGLVLLVGVAADGHAGGHAPAALLPAVAHAGGMSLWLGSLLAAAVLPARRPGGTASREGPILLSRMAPWCLNVVVASGLVLAWHTVPSVTSLWTSDYGRTLLLKLAVIAVLLGTAAVARSIVRHRPAPLPVLRRVGALRSAVTVELTVGICVLAVTAQLVLRQPPPA